MNDTDTIVATTQEHLEIEEIKNDLLFLKSGAAALVIEVSALNFGLLSEEEQDATIYAYAGLLNSLSFPIQILVKSDKKDISGYLELLSKRQEKIKDPTLKERMKSYRKFVEETIVERNVLEKEFYCIIPYKPVTLKKSRKIDQEFLKKALADLEPKRDHLIKQFARIGLTAQQLNSKNLLKLFHDLYNPTAHGQKLASPQNYEKTMVAPNVSQSSNSSS